MCTYLMPFILKIYYTNHIPSIHTYQFISFILRNSHHTHSHHVFSTVYLLSRPHTSTLQHTTPEKKLEVISFSKTIISEFDLSTPSYHLHKWLESFITIFLLIIYFFYWLLLYIPVTVSNIPVALSTFSYPYYAPTMTTIKRHKLQHFLHFNHTSPTYAHTSFWNILLINNVPPYFLSYKYFVSLPCTS